MSDRATWAPGRADLWTYEGGNTSGGGSASPIGYFPDQPLRRREFPPGFHGANPGPSYPEPKPRYRVKAHFVRVQS